MFEWNELSAQENMFKTLQTTCDGLFNYKPILMAFTSIINIKIALKCQQSTLKTTTIYTTALTLHVNVHSIFSSLILYL